jgi:hypothetical protein
MKPVDDNLDPRRHGDGRGLPWRTRLLRAAVVAGGASAGALTSSPTNPVAAPPLCPVLLTAPSGCSSSLHHTGPPHRPRRLLAHFSADPSRPVRLRHGRRLGSASAIGGPCCHWL